MPEAGLQSAPDTTSARTADVFRSAAVFRSLELLDWMLGFSRRDQ